MSRDQQLVGECPHCGQSNLACSYNHFESESLRIDSWEHKCPDCGHRETRAFRSDESGSEESKVDPAVCPWCGRRGNVAS